MRLLQHFPLRNFAHRQPERLQHVAHVNALVVRRHRFQAGDLQLEAGLEQVQQRRVDDGLVVMAYQAKAAAHRLALQRDRNQEQRRQVHRLGIVGLGPAQQADRQVERVGAALFQPGPGGAVDRQQVAVQRVLRRPRQQFPVAQGLQRHVVERRAACALRVHLRHARVGAFHQFGQRPDLELGAVGQRVFEPGQVGRDELQRGLGRLEIEQPVAQRQVEQPRFPGGQAPLGRVVRARIKRRQRIGVKRRQQRHCLDGRRSALGQRLARHAGKRARWQRPDLRFACAVDVDGITKAGVFEQLGMALLHGDPQRRPLAGVPGHAGGFKHQQLAAVDALANRLHIIDQHIGKRRQVQPDADPGMAFLQQNDRAQAGLLQTGGKQHRQVQAGGDARLQDTVGRADFLAVAAEGSRRLDVFEIFRRDRAVDAGHLFPDHIAAFRLVAVHRQLGVGGAQQPGRLANQAIDRRMVGHAKSRQQFGQRARSGPLVIGQDLDRLGDRGQFLPAGLGHNTDGRLDRFLQIGQKGMVRLQVQRRDSTGFPGGQLVKPQAQTSGKCRAA